MAANCFNMAFAGGLCAYWVYRLLGGHRTDGPTSIKETLAAGVAGYTGINVAAFFTALELGIQPLISYASSQRSYFPYGLEITLPAIMLPHLTLLGAMEAVMTMIIVGFVRKLRVLPLACIGAFFLAAPQGSMAHEFWIEGKGNELLLVFGHGSSRAEFEANNVKAVKAWGARGEEIQVTVEMKQKALHLRISQEACVTYAEIDNGYWSKTIYGWKNVGKSKASRVIEAIKSLNYAKKILCKGEAATRNVEGALLDIVPTVNPLEMGKGSELPVKVLFRGKPLPGVDVAGGEHKQLGKTDSEGILKVPVGEGTNLIAVTTKQPLEGDREADFLSITATLSFEVEK